MNYSELHRGHMSEQSSRILNGYKCLRIMQEVSPFRSIADFGCGIGGWLVAAKQLGVQHVQGIEGEWIKDTDTLVEKSEILICDFSESEINFKKSFDIAISIEVAEHLPADAADRFCDCLVNASELVMFSAAVPGQGGTGHLNEQKPRYWVDKFWERNYVPLEVVRPGISGDPAIFPWLKQNIIVFSSYQQLCTRKNLKRFMMPREYFYNRYAPM
jgi:hypothetical protein